MKMLCLLNSGITRPSLCFARVLICCNKPLFSNDLPHIYKSGFNYMISLHAFPSVVKEERDWNRMIILQNV